MLRVPLHLDDSAVFYFQKSAASGMAQTAVRPPDVSHGKTLLYLSRSVHIMSVQNNV
jgi:hypothetical protein